MTTANELTLLRVVSLVGAITLHESSARDDTQRLVARVIVLDEKTRAMWADPATRPIDRMALVRLWRAVYQEMRVALGDAGLVTNAPPRVVTMKAETEG